MSTKYPGGIISKTAPTPSGPYSTDTAPGVWTLEQQAYWQKLGQWPTAGNVNPNAFIENLFSTYLYTGTGASNTITNGLNESGQGALTWIKDRGAGSTPHMWFDTTRGVGNYIQSNSTGAQGSIADTLTAFSSTGFTLGADSFSVCNASGHTYASWTFRKQPKFFDVVTWTGDGVAGRQIPHGLGAVPGCIIVKCTSGSSGESWNVYHRSMGNNALIYLNYTDGKFQPNSNWNNTDPTSTAFTVSGAGGVNYNGFTYVAYLFAHDAGGFGLSGTENVISCGSFTTDGSGNADVNLGYEPQWVLTKPSSTTGNWTIVDSMRGNPVYIPATNNEQVLFPNTSASESSSYGYANTTSTGFVARDWGATPITFIYIAIRRGPMKVPTSGTSVFAIDTRNATTPSFVSNFPVDMSTYRAKSGSDWYLQSRLTPNYLFTNSTAAEAAGQVFSATQFAYNTGWGSSGASIPDLFSYMYRRAPSFFDEVCYTGTGASTTDTIRVNHNLGVKPELLITKSRSAGSTNWGVYAPDILPKVTGNYTFLKLNLTDAIANSYYFDVTSTYVDYIRTGTSTNSMNDAGTTYVSYLFATCAGVSKVGSYTGTGTTLQVDCGFTGGARFVLIKRTDDVGDWYVWDSARGIVAGNDPYLLLNSTAAEVTSTDYVDTYSAGFEISSTAPSAINASGGTFIFLAIA